MTRAKAALALVAAMVVFAGLALLAVRLYGWVEGFAAQTMSQPVGGLGDGPEFYGESSLEERIAGADVIARVSLLSVSPSGIGRGYIGPI